MRYSRKEIYSKVASKQMTVEEAMAYLENLQDSERAQKQPIREEYPLSEGQKGLWVVNQFTPGNYAYNCPIAFKISSDVDIAALKKTFQILIDRHPALRTRIHLVGSGPAQTVMENQEVLFEEKYLDTLADDEIEICVREEARKPFDLECGSLLKVTLFRLPEERMVLLINFHHIIYDGMSFAIFMREFQQIYIALKSGTKYELPDVKATYKDYVYWQQSMLQGEAGARHRDYWLKQLPDGIPAIDLKPDKPRPSVQSLKGSSVVAGIDRELTQSLKNLSVSTDKTLFVIMLSAFNVLLYRYTNQEDICVGTPMLGRPGIKFENVLGYFMNIVVIKSRLNSEYKFYDLVNDVQNTVYDAFDHSDYPVSTLIEEMRKAKMANAQLFQIAFYFQNWMDDLQKDLETGAEGSTGFMDFIPLPGIHQEGEFDLALEILENEKDLSIYFKYSTDIFEEQTIKRMLGHYTEILRYIVKEPSSKISDITLLTQEESNVILKDWNNTFFEYPSDKCVHELFEEQARKTPDAIAVIFEEKSITYGELSKKVTLLAAYLKLYCVEPGILVGIFMERSIEMVISLLAVLKAGGGYVPLDPTYPADRLLYMFEHSKMPILITQSSIEDRLPECKVELVLIDTGWDTIVSESEKIIKDMGDEVFRTSAKPENLAYVIYTSGSTGKPKGVKVIHRGFTNFLCSMAECPGFTDQDYILALTTICFDIAGLEIFLPLIKGGKVEMLPNSIAKDGIKLREKMENSPVTVMQATPATWQMLIAAGWEKKVPIKVLCGGEAMSRELADKLVERASEVWNMFGPTETTIWSSVSLVKANEKVTIGRPIANTQFYVLDELMKPVPAGVAGELYIGGDGLAEGYLNRPDITTEKFVKSPFDNNAIIYKTGDLVCYLPDGNIEYLSRIDHQVKVRGFRIELGEIESALKKIDEIEEAVVVMREETGHKMLVGFLIPKENVELPSKRQIGEMIKKWLPDYMVPASFVFLKSYPMTMNRKVDRKILFTRSIEEITKGFGGSGMNALEKNKASSSKPSTVKTHKTVAKDVNQLLLQLITDDLCKAVAYVIEGNADEIDVHTPLGEYGFDSIRYTTFSVILKQQNTLEFNPSIFVQYPTVESLAEYFFKNNYQTMRSHYAEMLEQMQKEVELQEDENVSNEVSDQGTIRTGTGTITQEPVAIIGIYGKMPGSYDLDTFWGILEKGESVISEIPDDRLELMGLSRKDLKSGAGWGAFIDDVERFDAQFFNMSKIHAEMTDIHQRLFLETAYNTIEDAGYKPSGLAGTKTGVFVGVASSDYGDILKKKGIYGEPYTIEGTSANMVANRVSNVLDLRGPSVAIDTACSSSLVAIHRAAKAVRDGECQIAIAGGVNLLLSGTALEGIAKNGMLSQTGTCRVFDKDADGYVRGEGVGAVLLKPLSKAVEDRDHIYGIIKASAENHCGSGNFIASPNSDARRELLCEAYERAGIGMDTIGLIEVSGSATTLGDSVEVNVLRQAFGENSGAEQASIGLGCVKANVGHLEAASGIASLFKVLLSMKNGKMPSTPGLKEPNPYIEQSNSPFFLLKDGAVWEPKKDVANKPIPRRAAINSFGSGGSNVHIILEQYTDERKSVQKENDLYLVVLSAKDENRLKHYSADLLESIEKNTAKDRDGLNLGDLAYTLQKGRDTMEVRLATVVSSMDELKEKLKAYCSGTQAKNLFTGNARTEKIVKTEADKKRSEEISLEETAATWVLGAEVEWEHLYKSELPYSISLPVYPFAGEKFFVRSKDSGVNKKIAIAGIRKASFEDMFGGYCKALQDKTLSAENTIDVVNEYINGEASRGNILHLFVEISNSSKMEVMVSGKGTPILLISGYAATAPQWFFQFKNWSSNHKLISINTPWHGMSEGIEDVSLAGIAKAYAEVLRELDITEPIHVIGASWGSMIAQQFVADFPEMVKTLTVVGGMCSYKVDDEEKTKEDLKRDFNNINAPKFYDLFMYTSSIKAEATQLNEIFINEGFSTMDILHKIKVPTLVVGGAKDVLIDHEQFQLLYCKLPDSRYYEMASAGHAPFITHHREFNKRVMTFIRDNEKR
ncbi:non-ribosomal peptide synthetase [Ruminiclostridium cellulolyticum]|uniref:Amino acid adenylation domain protein n=1 Tax=Ruminiclostridium cellulolyticum (strain ATCC 35319 / DSM 5812 / JCM 6584 / H10) TaxID=394503 RepID=B8I8K3_RUMCH|nr:non-ribosomal peptide synthetase [Ruminiclostridium cellulolyticum]ACL75236.1 amino acid adenylation domain protein [Ruminiclostridium cellulolyticum H10]